MAFSRQQSLLMTPLATLPLFTVVLYLSSVCPVRPDCFLLTTSPSSQTLFCESRFICSAYRFLLVASICIVLATTVVGLAWMATNLEVDLNGIPNTPDTENGWSDGFEEEDTDCEYEEVELPRTMYRD